MDTVRPDQRTLDTEAMQTTPPLSRRLLAEFIGAALLAAVVVGSGIAARQLSPNNVGLELLENAAATGTGLYVLILMFGPISGAHFNPVISLLDSVLGGLSRRDTLTYIAAQITGCLAGVILANGMFAQAAVSISTHPAPARRICSPR
jgi:glycerol uptake facilitator-like aquaporin